MKILTEKQRKVYYRAKDLLSKFDWFRMVSFINFPNDEKIDQDFEAAVNTVIRETRYVDDPIFFEYKED